MIYVDFAKAFDKVNHGTLIHKMRALETIWQNGVMALYLPSRKQTNCHSQRSMIKNNRCSVASPKVVLGPLLILTMISDFDMNINTSRITSFADDTRISRRTEKKDDVEHLQNNHDTLCDWLQRNNMTCKGDLFELVRYGNKRNFEDKGYLVGHRTIAEKGSVKDFGVIMSKDYLL